MSSSKPPIPNSPPKNNQVQATKKLEIDKGKL